jgi:cell division protease FtsH
MNRLVRARSSPVRQLLIEHLGRDPDDLPVLSESLESAEHPNVQLALDELAASGGWRVVGLSLGLRQYAAFSLGALATDRMADSEYPSPRPMPVEYVNLPIGPDDSLACVQLALYVGRWSDTPVAVLVMAGDERSHFESRLTLEVLAPDQQVARGL